MPIKSDKPFNFVKSFFELFKTYWGYVMTLIAAVSFVWTIGVKSERKSNERLEIKNDITEIKVEQKQQGNKVDSLLIIVGDINESQNQVIESQNALRNSYVKYVSSDKSLTMKDFLNYMEGIEFIVNPVNTPDTTKPKYIIGVKKLK